ncbi:P22 phage major capsid protein family protein [Acinetobacter sp. TY2]|uniref:P22 phage major capsid protein family protein n=1 Tax=Acinetobacter sp. TY2 TaxID=3387403 RepID=UPI0039176C74
MPNVINTAQVFAQEAAAIIEESCPFLMGINRSREKEFDKTVNGYQVGDDVSITIPGISRIYDGNVLAEGGQIDSWKERKVSLKVDNHVHAAFQSSHVENVFKLDASDPRRRDYVDRIFKPQIQTLCSTIEARLIKNAVMKTPYLVGTPGTVPNSIRTLNQARAKLQKALAPEGNRSGLISTDLNLELVDTSKALFNPGKQVSEQYRETNLGRASGADWDEVINLPTLYNGNKVAGVIISGASQTGETLVFGGLANGDTFKAGQVFTIAGVFKTHPLTGELMRDLQQFVVLADVMASAATAQVSIYPSLTPAMPNKTVNASPANGAVVNFYGGAEQGFVQNLLFQESAFTAAFVPAKIVTPKEFGYSYSSKGVRFTVQSAGDFKDLSTATRIDLMWGFTRVRDFACRITE